jgi:uncharacterized repeat protein (TIGR03803 family)
MNPKSPLRSAIGLLLFGAVILGLPPAARAAGTGTEHVLYSFQGIPDGSMPIGGVVFDNTGDLYGATTDGGSSSCNSDFECGTVYQLTQQNGNWSEIILHVFQGNTRGGDGATPYGGLIVDSTNNLYGTTGYGGSGHCLLLGNDVGCGTVYKMSPPQLKGGAWSYTILYNFQGGSDGYAPVGNLTFDKKGNLYGATIFGGGYGTCDQGIYPYCGTIFELSPPKKKGGAWTEKVLYSFKSGTDGANPNGNLVFDVKGAIYGTTFLGGNQGCQQGIGVGCGTVFKLSPPSKKGHAWRYEVLHRFNNGVPEDVGGDGENPAAGVLLGKQGVVYGTTERGVTADGTLFQLSPPTNGSKLWKESILHYFGNGFDAVFPGPIVFDQGGNIWGAAPGGTRFRGAIYRLKRHGNGWKYGILYDFTGSPDGYQPGSNLIFDSGGNLYGTTENGGTGLCQNGCGTVFEFTP